jgi:hypothetical protein
MLIHVIKEAIESYDPDNLDKFELYQHIASKLYEAGHSQQPAPVVVAQTVDRVKVIIEGSLTLDEAQMRINSRFDHLRKSKDKPSKS